MNRDSNGPADRSEWEYERRGSRSLWWILWAGIGAATAGEVILFVFMDPSGAHGPRAVGHLPASQLTVVVTVSLTMIAIAALVKVREVAGGGFPTALITWALFKGVAIAGLIVYQLADSHAYYWPFVVAFAAGMAWANPSSFEQGET